MSLVRRTPIDRDAFGLARNFFGWDPFGTNAERANPSFAPNFEVKETEDALVFTGDLPGVREEDIDLSLDGDVLTLSGSRNAEQKKEGETYFLYERQYGSFSRSFKLPDYADKEKISASLDAGVLALTIPKKAASKPRKIALKK